MSKKYSGAKKVEYSVSGANVWVSVGQPLAEGDIKNDVSNVDTAKGTGLYAGTNKEGSFSFADDTAFSALETGMKADTEYDIRVTYLDNTTEIIATATTVKATKNTKLKVGELNGFTLSYKVFVI